VGVQEEGGSYAASDQHFFNHESLCVYQRSLELHEDLGPILCANKSENRYLKRIDELSTSLTLNIAEGNGRFSSRDHGAFISVAADSGTRLAAYMDLATAAGAADMDGAKSLLRDIMTMLSGLEGYFDSKS
jgi:four helix bundle protein